MSTLTKDAVRKAIALLAAAGAEYAVSHEGETFSNVVLKPDLPARRPKYRPIVAEFVSGLVSPCVATYSVPEGHDFGLIRGALSSAIAEKFGAGNYMVKSNRKTRSIEVLIV